MLHPSYSELMAVANSEVAEGEELVVQSRYSIVKATANRAKQIIDARFLEEKYDKLRKADKDEKDPFIPLEDRKKMAYGATLVDSVDSIKPLSVAVEEFYQGKVKIIAGSTDDDSEETTIEGNSEEAVSDSSDENTEAVEETPEAE